MLKASELIPRLPLLLLALATLLPAAPAVAQGEGGERPRVIILGFDGADPDRVQEYMDAGHLPHLQRLAEQGSFGPLGTSNPAESPVSWANFTTGKGPGHHGIFDFLRRTPGTYFPEIALATEGTRPLLPSSLARAGLTAGLGLVVLLLVLAGLRVLGRSPRAALLAGIVVALPFWALGAVATFRWLPRELPEPRLNREGTPFWDIAAGSGVRVTAIDIPVTFPATGADGVQLTTGLGTPDIRKTWGNWSVYSSVPFEEEFSETAGNLKHVMMNGDRGVTTVRGPANFMAEGKPEISPEMVLTRQGNGLRIEVQGHTLELAEGEWSDFVALQFRMNPLVKLVGMTRFKLLRGGEDFHLYQEPLNFHPHHLPPTVAISHPKGYAGELADRYGLRETLGWSIATNPLKDEQIDHDSFLEDLEFTMERREQVIEGELARDDWDLFIGVFLSTDRMQHMMYRFVDEGHPFHDEELAAKYGDRILWSYQQMDRIVGEVMAEHVDDRTHLMVISDHGFHSFRRGVNLNTWLVKNGFMALKGLDPDANYQRLEDFFDPEGRFFQNVDWSRTQAYCLGLGSIYLNLRGRESQGAVNPSEYAAVRDSLAAALGRMEDPDYPGQSVVRNVFSRDEIFRGPRLYEAPDLFVGFESNWRVSWQTAAGGIPPEVFEDNMNNWSGDHCSVSPDISGGIFFSSRPLPLRQRNIVDIAPTVLELFGVDAPDDLEGSSLLGN